MKISLVVHFQSALSVQKTNLVVAISTPKALQTMKNNPAYSHAQTLTTTVQAEETIETLS